MGPRDRSGFEIAIICALTLEAAAVDALFAETYKGLGKQEGDQNIYTTGRIEGHNIVLAHMPGEGKGRAAAVAQALRTSFTGIKIALVVGICGAVPFDSGKEIVLGDVIISDGVIQHDLGKKYPDRFEIKNKIKDSLPRLSRELTALLNKLSIPRNLRSLRQRTSDLLVDVQNECGNEYEYPGTEHDKLFETAYRHKHYVRLESGECETCGRCESGKDAVCELAKKSLCQNVGCQGSLLPRERLDDGDRRPDIHIGTIASGDTVMKSGEDRDEIARQLPVVAFEMEGAGVWDNLPCLVIKGVCDYADCHKNDKFQRYAAATAAACAKAFLEEWSEATAQSSVDVRQERSPEDLCLGLLHKSTSDYDFDRERTSDRAPATCEWILKDERYIEWRKENSGLLWVSASPGCGKSYLASFLVEELRSSNSRVCFFFFKHDNDHKFATSALCALLHQLFLTKRSLVKYALPYFEDGGKFVENLRDLWKILTTSAADPDCGNVVCVIDGMDECERPSGEEFAETLRTFWKGCGSRMTNKMRLKLLVTSRAKHWIETPFQNVPRLNLEDEINHIVADIALVIEAQLPQVGDDLRKAIIKRADGTFLWVGLVLEMIRTKQCNTLRELEELFIAMPGDLNLLYENILGETNNREEATKLLHIIVAAARPLTLEEMRIAQAIGPDHESIGELKKDLRVFPGSLESHMKKSCGVFIRIIDSKIYLVHETAKDFLVRNSMTSSPGFGTWMNSLHPAESNLFLAERCMWYLLLSDFDHYHLAIKPDWGGIEIHTRPHDFLDYAAKHWADHFREVQVVQGQALLKLALRICDTRSQRFLTWFQVFWDRVQLGYRCPQGFTDLIIASYNGHETVARWLIETGAGVGECDRDGRTALHWAANRGHDAMAQLLLGERANINAKDNFWRTALHLASESSHPTVIQLLVEKGADITGWDRNRWTALRWAARRGDSMLVQLLLARMAAIKVKDALALHNALYEAVNTEHKAADNEYRVVVKLLVENVADGEVKDKALNLAIKRQKVELARLLVEKGAKVNQTEGRMALHWAVRGAFEAGVRFLLEVGVNVDARDEDGSTPLHTAAGQDQETIARLLLEKHADVRAKDGQGLTALHVMARHVHRRESEGRFLQLLLRHGADVSAEDDRAPTPLHTAASSGRRELVRLLIENKARVDARNVGGLTPLHSAAKSSLAGVALVRLLVQKGADPNSLDRDGRTPLQLATESKREEVERFLTQLT